MVITSRNDDKKIMQLIRTTSGLPTTTRKWNQFSKFRWASTKAIPIKKDLSWLHFSDKARVQ